MPRLLTILTLLLIAHPSLAGSICGTVRDAATTNPVSSAGVFAYQDGVYAGYHAVTDPSGQYCIDDIPDGSYDLVVRVDNYQIARVSGVIVDTVTSVDILSSSHASLDAPWPNPSSAGVFLRYRLPNSAALQMEIFDLRGRRVHGWAGSGKAGDSEIYWDFRDRSGGRVASGSYLIRLTVDGQTLTRMLQRID